MKKLIAGILLLALACFTLTACAGWLEPTDDSTTTSAESESYEVETTTEESDSVGDATDSTTDVEDESVEAPIEETSDVVEEEIVPDPPSTDPVDETTANE